FGLFWFRYVKIPLLQGLDLLALTGALSMGIARWGCFFSGCCHGNPTDLPWGVTFPAIARELHAGLPAVPIHPTQVYLSLNSLVIFGLLVLLYRRKRFHGQIMMVYLMLYAVTRYFIEFVRGDAVRGFVIEGLLSTSQFISVVAFIAAGTTLYVLSRRHRASGQPDWQPAAANAPIAEPAARSQKRKRRRR
ncbi:MAG: prolipoprotein diacylglyceryl transferase, partial [Acidobacteriota bacterium]